MTDNYSQPAVLANQLCNQLDRTVVAGKKEFNPTHHEIGAALGKYSEAFLLMVKVRSLLSDAAKTIESQTAT